jgi:hypothetical protein
MMTFTNKRIVYRIGLINRFLIAVIMVLVLIEGVAYGQDPIEKAKISFLISSIENTKGVKFIHNGSEYDRKEAASHLRMKLQAADGKVKTADDFIRLCASNSYMTGKPYLIKYPDGRTIRSAEYFRERLKAFKPNAK